MAAGRACASVCVARSAGDGDSFSSSTAKCRIHSAQSSFVLRWLLSHARRSAASFTASRCAPAVQHSQSAIGYPDPNPKAAPLRRSCRPL